MVTFPGVGDRERVQRGASGAIGNVLLFFMGASYMGSVFENSSSWTLDFSFLYMHIVHHYKVNNGPKLSCEYLLEIYGHF